MLIGIDPGSQQSAFITLKDGEILDKGITENLDFLTYLRRKNNITLVCIELIKGYGNQFGDSLIQTCIFTGRIIQLLEDRNIRYILSPRKTIVTHHLGTAIANDTDVRRAMIKRFGDKGSKADPGKTFGVVKDMWQALAVAAYAEDFLETINYNDLTKLK